MSILILSGAALAFSGFAATSLTMDRHYADIHGRGKECDTRTRLRLRALGWLGLLLSFIACIGASGWHLGPVLWCGELSIAAWILTLLLQYHPRKVAHAAWIGLPATLLTAALLLRHHS